MQTGNFEQHLGQFTLRTIVGTNRSERSWWVILFFFVNFFGLTLNGINVKPLRTAGKSTLLQILSGRRTSNVKGEVYLHASEEKNLKECKLNKLSFIPQHDSHIENLTVKETLIYASKLKNNERAKALIKQNNQDNSQDASSQDGSSNATISLANTSPTNLTNSSSDTILYSGSNSSSSSLNVASHVDSSSVESNLVNHPHLAGTAAHLSAQRLAGASVHNVNLAQNLDRLETQTNSSSHSDRTAASVPSADTLEVNIVHEKQTPMLLNFTHVDQYHDYLVQQIIGQLMLDTCAQTFVCKCSGGQLKRLSIAIELLSEPKVLVMDEPTTGLDFSSALNCIQILKNLTINNFDPPGKQNFSLDLKTPNFGVLGKSAQLVTMCFLSKSHHRQHSSAQLFRNQTVRQAVRVGQGWRLPLQRPNRQPGELPEELQLQMPHLFQSDRSDDPDLLSGVRGEKL